jgi:hypothetical protein
MFKISNKNEYDKLERCLFANGPTTNFICLRTRVQICRNFHKAPTLSGVNLIKVDLKIQNRFVYFNGIVCLSNRGLREY